MPMPGNTDTQLRMACLQEAVKSGAVGDNVLTLAEKFLTFVTQPLWEDREKRKSERDKEKERR